MRDCLMMRDMARAYKGLIMNNIKKAKDDEAKDDVTKVNELLDDFYIKDTNYHIEGEFKPFGVTDET